MGVEQVYNPMSGINRMITDIESMMEPFLYKYHPILHLISKANLYVVSGLFALLLFYIIAIRKHSVIKRFKVAETYIMTIAGLLVFYLLNENTLRLGPSFRFNFGLIVIPVISKFLGPIVATLFGLLQYCLQFLGAPGQQFSLAGIFIGGISGIIYALFIYDRRTKYLRCLTAKLTVNIVCNILLVPLTLGESMTPEIAKFITDRILENLFLAPIQALVIYGALKLSKKIYRLYHSR